MIPSSACRQSQHADQPGRAGNAWRPYLSYTTQRGTIQWQSTAYVSPHWTKYGAGAVGVGWELGLLGLSEHLKRPADDVRAEGVNGWETSPEAKDLVRQASAGWGEAEITAGERPEQARGAAEATRRFYSGEPPQED